MPVGEDEAQAFWDGRRDYELTFWTTLNQIADQAAQVETTNMDGPIVQVMNPAAPMTPDKKNRAWLTACYHALFSPYNAQKHNYFLHSERILAPVVADPSYLYRWNTYIIRKPNPVTYTKLLGTSFADDYRNHAAFYTLLVPNENHTPYAITRTINGA